jgi:two-component system phosphate regulon sensor histidine kinase PhoR
VTTFITILIFAISGIVAIASLTLARYWFVQLRNATTEIEKAIHDVDTAQNEGETARIHGCIDRTRRRQAEAVFDVLRDAVIVVDAHGEILHANAAASGLLSVTPEEAAGKVMTDVVNDHQLASTISAARNGLPTEGRLCEQELFFNSEPVSYEVHLQSVGGHEEPMHAVVTVLRDLSREREVARLKSDFVSKASHELRTPLSSISAYIEMLVDGDAEDEDARQEFYKVISTETDRLRRLIDNLLNISRIEAGLMHIEREQVQIGELVERAVQSMMHQAKENNLDIHTKLAQVDLTITGDSDMLYQVIVNLLSNAIKYTPQGGRITVAADADHLTRSLHLSVADTGLGIAPDETEKVFDKFYRVENYRRIANGTGLGLNLCRHIVETLHNGQIGLDSTLGMGSRFWFTIPMQERTGRVAA